MKKSLNIFALALALLVVQACGKKEKNSEEYVASETPAVTAAVVAKPTLAERRATIEKARAEREAQRRVEFEARWKAANTYTDAEGNLVYNKAELDPSFTGGEKAMNKYLQDNLVYPQDAMDKGVEGTVFVDFVIGADGTVREAAVTDAPGENVDASLRAEAIRVVRSMPKWVPGRQHGKPVHVNYSLPVTFMLSN